MKIIKAPRRLTEILKDYKLKGKIIGFVPTMGAFHEGHLTLIRKARQENDIVVVSIFVNPTQFGPKEDFKRYPRPIKSDITLCRKEKVDFLFCPSVEAMYPEDFCTYVTVEVLSDVLCGKFRPSHFRGVATVVTKLFNIVNPDIAYFGQKDAQQAIIIKRMICDLNIPVKIKVMPTIRQKDGLALSSRNIYLDKNERKDALVLSQALKLAKNLIKHGNRNSAQIIQRMKQLIEDKKTAEVQYITIVDTKNLKPIDTIKGKVLIALAIFIGKTRLIDNIIINPR